MFNKNKSRRDARLFVFPWRFGMGVGGVRQGNTPMSFSKKLSCRWGYGILTHCVSLIYNTNSWRFCCVEAPRLCVFCIHCYYIFWTRPSCFFFVSFRFWFSVASSFCCCLAVWWCCLSKLKFYFYYKIFYCVGDFFRCCCFCLFRLFFKHK